MSNPDPNTRFAADKSTSTAAAAPSAASESPAVASIPVETLVLPGCEVRRAHPEETASALRLILAPSGYPAEDAKIAEFTALAVRRRIDLSAIVVVARRGSSRLAHPDLLWAALPLAQPGRSVLLLTPARTDRDALAPAAAAIDLSLRHLAPPLLAQALVDPDDPSAVEPLARSGFQPLATLVYLQRVLTGPPAAPGTPHLDRKPLQRVTYSPKHHALFRQALADSYVGSLDCPRLTGLRELDDTLAGHRASGQHNPDLWTVLVDEDRPAGVVLLSPTDHDDALELVYLGISPAYRRRGLAHWCLQHALRTASDLRLSRLLLAVDSENRPALRLYYRFGLKRFHQRLAMFRRMLPQAAEQASPSGVVSL